MKKRILSALMALIMVFGLIPMPAFAETGSEGETVTPTYLAAYAKNVVVDGDASETAWNLSGNLTAEGSSETYPFDILWDAQGLYLAVKPAAAETSLTFAAGDGSVTATNADTNWDDTVEVRLAMTAVGGAVSDYGEELPVTVTVGDHRWSGNVVLTSNERAQKVTGLNRTQSADDTSNTTNLKTYVTEDGGMRFTRLYGNGTDTTAYDAAFYKTGAANFPALVASMNHVSIEFDFVADAMPAYNSIHYLSGSYAARGFSACITNGVMNASTNDPSCLSFGITNSNGDMYFMVGHGMDRGTTGTVEAVNTGKTLGEKFHVQMITDNAGNMSLYIDGELKRVFEGAVIDNYPLGNPGVNGTPVVRLANYGNPSVDGKKADGSDDVDFTVSNLVIGNTQGASVLDSLTFDAIKGTNTNPNAVSGDLVLSTTLSNPHISGATVIWSSSDETVVSTTGKVNAASEDKTVTLTATLSTNSNVKKDFILTIPKMVIYSSLIEETITLDGVLSESSWAAADGRSFTAANGASGDIASLWKANTAYFAVNYTGADTLALTLGEESWSFALAEAINVDGGTITGVAKNGVAELKVDLAKAGIVMEDYKEEYAIQAVLSSSTSSNNAQLENSAITLIFSNEYYQTKSTAADIKSPSLKGVQVPSGATAQATSAWDSTEGAWKHSSKSTNHLCYWIKTGIEAMDHSMDVLTEMELNVTALPVAAGSFSSQTAATGIYFWVTDAYHTEGYTEGYISFGRIYNAGSGALRLKVYNTDADIDLGVSVGTKFTLGYLWNADGSAEVYVNGVKKGTVENATTTGMYAGDDAVQIRANTPTAGEEAAVSIYSLNVTASGSGYVTLEEELAPANVLKDVKLTSLTNADTITLPGTFETKLGTMTLTWESGNDYITLVKNADGSYTGTVHQPMTKVDVVTDLAMYANGTHRWDAETVIVGLQSGMETTADTLRVPFTAKAITLDGATTDEGWSLDIKVLKNNAAAGFFGAQWDKDNLYMAVDTKGAALSVTINDKTVDLSGAKTSGNVKEFAVKLADIGVDLKDYGEVLTVKVALGEAVWVGKFVLTSTDWFLTDGVEPRIQIGLKGSAALGADAVTTNQGYEDLGNGWRLFDTYDPTGANPKSIRTYLILWARGGTEEQQAVFRPLNDRTTPTYTEFDFLAKSMPIYNPGTGSNGATDWSSIYSNYGLTWNVAADSDQPTGGNALSVSMGIYNSEEGLMFCVLGKDKTTSVPLGKFLGDQFRIGTSWNVDGSLTVYVDGVEIETIPNAETVKSGYGDESVVINLIRSPNKATSAADSFDIYLTNISVGKSRGNSIFDALTIEDILGNNIDPYSITEDLTLVESLYDEQLDITAPLTWTINETGVIAQNGTVTRPANGGKLVQLTASWNGNTRTFEVYVKGLNYTSNTYVVSNDLDTKYGKGILYDSYNFTLDTENNSIIYDQGSSKKVNLITLTDGDESNRLNESCLTIWVSDDNKTYTQVEGGFKIKKEGSKVYLYDFVAEGRYIKVHCTHYLGDEADFIGPQEQMLKVAWEEYLDPSGSNDGILDSAQMDVENTTGETKYDETWCADYFDAAENMLVYGLIDGEWQHLYFYAEGGEVYVRIPEIAAGESVTVAAYYFSTDILNLQNKEYTLEVVYGTRETRVYDGAGRWVVELPDGRIMAINNTGDGVTEDHGWLTYCYSYNGGMTWTEPLPIPCTVDWLHNAGGVTYDPNNGRIIVEGYQYKQFVAGDVAASDCKLRFVYSDDLGQTWTACPEVTFENDKTATYVLSYSDPVIVSSYDGEGPNIDMVLNNGVQYDDTGSFCCRVAYTRDAGKTWILGDDEIRYAPGSGILAYEGGVSEGTILEVKDKDGNGTGKLVLYARCQYDNVDVFCKAYSNDYGANWTTAAELTDLYTVNTQPIMHEYGDAQLMFWGGNNVLGGNSYQRMPMNVAISYDGMESFVNIQDLYARYSLQGMTTATRNQIINQSVANEGDTVTLVWDNNFKESLIMRIDNFTDWFYRTKGIWDSFEYTTTKAEGWSTTSGTVEISDMYALDGDASMKLAAASSAVRSVPYLQNGTLSFDMYLFDNPKFQVELESAYGTVYGKAAPMGFTYEDGKFVFLGSDTAYPVTLKSGDWNNFSFQLDLDAETPVAELYVNGTKVADVPVNADIGSYVCWLDINTNSVMYVDCVYVDDNDYVEVPETPADPVENQAELPKLSVSLTLNETIDINFFINPEYVTGGNRIVVRKNGEILDESKYTLRTTADGRYRVRYCSNADKMSDIISVQVVDVNGKPVTQERVMSARGYARERLNNSLASQDEKRLLMAMLDYGTLSQLYQSDDAVELANRYVGEELREFLGATIWPTVNEAQDVITGNKTSSGFGIDLTLNENIDVNFYTEPENLAGGNRVKLLCNGVELAESKYTLALMGDGRIRIRYSVNANRMCDMISIQIVDANGDPVKAARTISVRAYAMTLLNDTTTDAKTARLLIMMLDYGTLSQMFMNTNALTTRANNFVTEEHRKVFDGFVYPCWD